MFVVTEAEAAAIRAVSNRTTVQSFLNVRTAVLNDNL
jgi:hypothetical protein